MQWAFASPASAVPVPGEPGQYYNAANDPTGAFAQALNLGPMFFVSGIGNPTTERTLNVAQGTAVLFPIVIFEDTEGPNGSKPPLIPPSIPGFKGSYAQEVDAVLDASSFSGIVLKVDGNVVKKLRKSIVNDFSADVVLPGSEGQVFFTGPSNPLPAGTVLYPSGTEGYYVNSSKSEPRRAHHQHAINLHRAIFRLPLSGVFRGTLGNYQRRRIPLSVTWLAAGGERDVACRLRSAVAREVPLPVTSEGGVSGACCQF